MRLSHHLRIGASLLAVAALTTGLMGAASLSSVTTVSLGAETQNLMAKENFAMVSTGTPQAVTRLHQRATDSILTQRYAAGEGAYVGFVSPVNSGTVGAIAVLVVKDKTYALSVGTVSVVSAHYTTQTYPDYATAQRASRGLLPSKQPGLYRG